MDADISINGDDPLADGRYISLRYRLDFRVVDAGRVLAAGRAAYRRLHPEATEKDSVAMVTCAADAVYALLEAAGAIADHGEAVAAQSGGGLEPLGGRSQLAIDEPEPLPAGRDCFGTGTCSRCRPATRNDQSGIRRERLFDYEDRKEGHRCRDGDAEGR